MQISLAARKVFMNSGREPERFHPGCETRRAPSPVYGVRGTSSDPSESGIA